MYLSNITNRKQAQRRRRKDMRARGLVVILYVFMAVVMLSFMTSFIERSNQISQQREAILQQQEEIRREAEEIRLQAEAARMQWENAQP